MTDRAFNLAKNPVSNQKRDEIMPIIITLTKREQVCSAFHRTRLAPHSFQNGFTFQIRVY